jgi:hypothetical protein
VFIIEETLDLRWAKRAEWKKEGRGWKEERTDKEGSEKGMEERR